MRSRLIYDQHPLNLLPDTINVLTQRPTIRKRRPERYAARLNRPCVFWQGKPRMLQVMKFIRTLSGAATLALAAASSGAAQAEPLKFTINDGGFSGFWI